MRYHYVIVDYLCDYVSGTARAGSDAEASPSWRAGTSTAYDLPPKALEVVLDGFRRAGALADLPARAAARRRLLK